MERKRWRLTTGAQFKSMIWRADLMRIFPSFSWNGKCDSRERSESVHCSIWWMSRCDGRVLEKNFMKTYCVRLVASAGAPEHASRVEFLRQKIKKPTMIRDFFKNPEVQVELAA